jgi:hypothetical protein
MQLATPTTCTRVNFANLALEKSSMYELSNKYSVVVVRLTPSLPQRERHPKGNPLDPLAKFSINPLAQRGSDEVPERPPMGGEMLTKFKRPHL